MSEVATIRPLLLAEFPVYVLQKNAELVVKVVIVYVLTVDQKGQLTIVIDCRSDVNPT